MSDQEAKRSRLVQMSEPVYQRLTAIKAEQERQRGRQVTYSEVLEGMLDVYAEVTA